MALSEAKKSSAVAIIRLMQMTTVPTTEELLYILAMAKKSQKPVELPFKNPYNNITFMVRVTPGTSQFHPTWTFERCDNGGNVLLWRLQSNEVIMIQGKVKIEANYTGAVAVAENSENSSEEMIESFRTTGSQPIVMGSPSNSQSNLFPVIAGMAQRQDQDQNQDRDQKQDQDQYLAEKCQSSSGTWLFNDRDRGPVMMPQPVALNDQVVNNYMGALSNPKTGFLRHTAFEFFLLRDLAYVRKFGGKLSLVIFDFIDPQSGCTTDVCDQVAPILMDSLNDLFSPVELLTQLKTGEYAVLLCGYDSEKALHYARTLWSRLSNCAPPTSILADGANMSMGVACIPDTCKEPGVLLAAAIKAKDMARAAKRGYMLFPLF